MSTAALPAAAQALEQRRADAFEADVMAAERAQVGRWVEWPLGREGTRQYVALMARGKGAEPTWIHWRVDSAGGDATTVTQVETMRIDCDAGEQRVMARSGFDSLGQATVSNPGPDPASTPIGRTLDRAVCAYEYLKPMVADWDARFARLLADRLALARLRVPDRRIPVPAVSAATPDRAVRAN